MTGGRWQSQVDALVSSYVAGHDRGYVCPSRESARHLAKAAQDQIRQATGTRVTFRVAKATGSESYVVRPPKSQAQNPQRTCHE